MQDRKIVYGTATYESLADCMEDLGLSRSILVSLIAQADAGQKPCFLGQRIYAIGRIRHHAKRPSSLPERIKRRPGPLLPVLCTHRLAVYHGGSH